MRNPSYSLRAFARDVGMQPSKLSEVFNGKKGISLKKAGQLTEHFKWSAAEKDFFLTSVEAQHSRSGALKRSAIQKLKAVESLGDFKELNLDQFRVIADWEHFAILELCEVKGFVSDPKWISQRLGLSLSRVNIALERLKKYGFLKSGSKIEPTVGDLATPSEIPSREIRNHHTQILTKAIESLDKTQVEDRDIGSITFAIDSSRMNEAKRKLRELRLEFCKEFQKGKSKDRVYCLNVSFFPLDETK